MLNNDYNFILGGIVEEKWVDSLEIWIESEISITS